MSGNEYDSRLLPLTLSLQTFFPKHSFSDRFFRTSSFSETVRCLIFSDTKRRLSLSDFFSDAFFFQIGLFFRHYAPRTVSLGNSCGCGLRGVDVVRVDHRLVPLSDSTTLSTSTSIDEASDVNDRATQRRTPAGHTSLA